MASEKELDDFRNSWSNELTNQECSSASNKSKVSHVSDEEHSHNAPSSSKHSKDISHDQGISGIQQKQETVSRKQTDDASNVVDACKLNKCQALNNDCYSNASGTASPCCNYQPFVIVGELLKKGSITSDNVQYNAKKRHRSCMCSKQTHPIISNQTCAQCEKDRLSTCSSINKRRKPSYFDDKETTRSSAVNPSNCDSDTLQDVNSGSSNTHDYSGNLQIIGCARQSCLIDLLISDLDEISEIPFFDINLPRELAMKIFKHLSMRELCSCAQVSRSWRSLADDELLWFKQCTGLGYAHDRLMLEETNWKSYVRQCVLREENLMANWKGRVGQLSLLEFVQGGVLCAAHSHQTTVVAGYTSGHVRMWDLQTGDGCVFQPSSTALVLDEVAENGTENNYVIHIATSDDFTAASYKAGNIDMWYNAGSTTVQHTFHCSQAVSQLSLHNTKPVVAVAYGSSVRLDWAEEGNDFTHTQTLNMGKIVQHLKLFSKDESYHDPGLVAIATDSIVNLLNVGEDAGHMTEIHNLIGAPVTALDVNPVSGQMAVALSSYGGPFDSFRVKCYSLTTGQLLATLGGHTWIITCLELSGCPNGMVTGSGDRKVRIYDIRLGPSPVATLSGHNARVTSVQMDEWKVVSSGEEGVVSVWDQRMAAVKLWDWHSRHPVRYCHYNDNWLVVGNVPMEKFPVLDTFESVAHKRFRGSVQAYNFLSDQGTKGLPDVCLSSYDTADGYDYNIRLAMPYDRV